MAAMKVQLVGSEPVQPVFRKSNSSSSLNNVDLVKSMPTHDLKAYQENPIKMAEAMNYKDKPTMLSYSILYQMSVKNSVVCAVINTRVNQVSTFTKPARFSEDGVGYKIRLRDPNAVPTDEQQDIINSMELFLENCGFNNDNDRDDFDTFIRKITRDSLTYDQATFEVIPDKKGKPAEFVCVDAATIRAATENFKDDHTWTKMNYKMKKGQEAKWVQVIDGVVVAWFTDDELAFGVRNPRSNINMQPYGFSELEQLINQITSHLYAEEYNSKFFSQGGTTKGIINLKGDPNGIGNKEQLESFKRQWRAQVNGMQGAWKTPVLQVPEGVEYINVSQSNREMEFEKWMNYLVNIVCAVYQIDPSEINFANNGGVGGGQQSVFESNNETKLKNSKDKGLKPLLRFIESIINKFIISKFSEDYVFCFTGLDDKSDDEKAELDSKESHVWKTVNEIRKDHGYEPIDNGDVILDPSWLNYQSQQAMMNGGGMMGDEEEGMGEMGGEEDEDGGLGGSPEDYSEDEMTDESYNDENSYEDMETDLGKSRYYDNEDVKKSMSKLILTIQ